MKLACMSTAMIAMGTAEAAKPPISPTPVGTYSQASGDRFREMKVSIAADDSSTFLVHVGDVVLCARSACYGTEVERSLKVSGTDDGTASTILDVALPAGEKVESLYFDAAGSGRLSGSLKLDEPAVLDKELHGEEIMILLAKKSDKSDLVRPVASAVLPYDAHWSTIYYNPRVRTAVDLQGGNVELALPAGAVSRPCIFGVLIRDIGNDFPSVDIYPKITLSQPAALSVRPLRHSRFSADGQPPAAIRLELPGKYDGLSRRVDQDGTLHVEVGETGLLAEVR